MVISAVDAFEKAPVHLTVCPVRSLTCMLAGSGPGASYTFIICKTAGKSSLCEIGMGNDPAALQVSEQGVCSGRGGVGRVGVSGEAAVPGGAPGGASAPGEGVHRAGCASAASAKRV